MKPPPPLLDLLSLLRKLSSRNNNINGVNKWSVIIARAGGGASQLRYNVLLPVNTPTQYREGRDVYFITK